MRPLLLTAGVCLLVAGCSAGTHTGHDGGVANDGDPASDVAGSDATDDTTLDNDSAAGDAGTRDGSSVRDASRDTGVRRDAGPPQADADGDGIGDVDEGRDANVDTDGDGTPDFMDDDSDGDGIPDSVEAGDADTATPPVDSDLDGTPDFRDLDSDNNGWPDASEGSHDFDSDGIPDYADDDNDGDFLADTVEIGPDPTIPRDTNADGFPDLDVVDADGDNILDADEGASVDTDNDGMPDRIDLDSDGDGLLDIQEAGDADPNTPAVDTDGDGTADYRDLDSDADGLSDALELQHGTSPLNPDTDGDGVSDLIEVGAGTDPLNAADNPRARGNFVFLVPYRMNPTPPRDTLQFSTTITRADVYFLMDTTGSMGGERDNLVNGLMTTLIPQIRAQIPDAWMGVGHHDDYPYDDGTSFGNGMPGTDLPYENFQNITGDDAAVQAAVSRLTIHSGNDEPESGLQAMYAIATGQGLSWPRGAGGTPAGSIPAGGACPAGYWGYPCFRPDAVPIIVHFTDAHYHNGPSNEFPYSFTAPTYPQVISALVPASMSSHHVRVVTVNSDGGFDASVRADKVQMANDTGAVSGGMPLVYDISSDGTGLSGAVVDGIQAISRAQIDVSAQAVDVMDPGENVDAVAAFVDHLETRTTAATGRMCTLTYPTQDRPGIDNDNFPDTFVGVHGDPVCFDIVVKVNDTVMPTADPQVFRAKINVIGDGFTPLDHRDVYFLVPPVVGGQN